MTPGPAHELADQARPGPMIGRGSVRHTRLRPLVRRFAYPTYFWLLPMRRLRASPEPLLRRERPGLMRFCDADHGDGRSDSLAWAEELLAQAGVIEPEAEIWLQCFPRVLGVAFKPVSFWYVQRPSGDLAAVLVEVNNTFGQRHSYVLHGEGVAWGRELRAAKVFHVSPFCAVEGGYRFRFARRFAKLPTMAGESSQRICARIDHDDAQGVLLQTSIEGRLQALNPSSLRATFWGLPWLSLAVWLRIHWQALQLWWLRVRFHSAPPLPPQAVSLVRVGTVRSS